MNNIIVRPLITEKSMRDAAKSKYTFVVTMEATKKLVREAVEKMFNVHVLSIAIIVVKGKTKRTGARRVEKTISSMKKAIVTVKSGEKISLFELQS
jgi:large subunit ribosomal protein L23